MIVISFLPVLPSCFFFFFFFFAHLFVVILSLLLELIRTVIKKLLSFGESYVFLHVFDSFGLLVCHLAFGKWPP